MSSHDFTDLMWRYARRGIADWNKAERDLQLRASKCLGPTAIAEKEYEASTTIHTFYNGTDVTPHKFIPMPKLSKKGIQRCFFLPVRELLAGGAELVSFELFLLVEKTNCLAFRFEPAHKNSVHNYGHLQLSRSMLRKNILVSGIPDWMPVTHPAFPVLTADPLEVFLCMITAVHGYGEGSTEVLRDIFAGQPGEFAKYSNMLKAMLL